MPRRIHTTLQTPPVEAEPIAVQEAPPEPAWPVLTPEERQAIKDRNPGVKAFVVTPAGQPYVIKPLSAREWHTLSQQVLKESKKGTVDTARQDEMIANASILWPVIDPNHQAEFWRSGLAGTAHSLALQVRQKSGFATITEEGEIVGDQLSVTPLFVDEEVADIEEPTDEELEAMRAQSPNRQVYRAELVGFGVHYFRPWTRTDWISVQQQEERESDFRDFAVRAALLWSSEDWNKPLTAGLIGQLFSAILEASGFNVTPTVEAL